MLLLLKLKCTSFPSFLYTYSTCCTALTRCTLRTTWLWSSQKPALREPWLVTWFKASMGLKKENIAGKKQRYVLALSAEKHLPCDLQTATFSTTACSDYSNKVHSWRQRAEVVWLRKRCTDTIQGLNSACNQGWHKQTPVEARWCTRGTSENKNDRRAHFLWEPLHSSNEELPCGNIVARSSRGPENQNLYVKYLNF